MVKSKSRNNKIKVNIDEILRIGSIMERSNIRQQSREAFDWLAENRDEMDNNPKNFANHLITAVGDLVMQKLMKDGIVTLNEYERNFRRFEDSTDEQLPTVVLISYMLKENCAYFQVG
ncbi:hypothetical protein LOAG_05084 [Loa loa]|uniref:Uncharacterized protein n=2 Tax=Loa loa TaxID=7209 RepID=A0A1S0U0R4_LOALO|nr:hypothetical protein LOAG_05084 [Loa loa]EFO23400.1 hypothetical protein LOAG_05084 [Loa loa]